MNKPRVSVDAGATDDHADATSEQPKDTPATAETVNNAIRWFRANEQAIAQALPLHTPGVTFGPAWPTQTLAKYIQSWEAGTLRLPLAVAYVVNPLRIIKKALSKRND